MNHGMGALPPPGLEWMEGKTVEEINAIHAEALATGHTTADVAAGEDWKKHLPVNQGMTFDQFKEFLISWGLSFDTPDGDSSTIPYPAVFSRMMDDALARGGQKLTDFVNSITDTMDGQTYLLFPIWENIHEAWSKYFS